MSIKKKTLRARDKVLGISRINDRLEGIESMSGILNDIRNNLTNTQTSLNNLQASLGARPITIQIDQNTMLTRIFTGLKIYLDPRDLAVAVHIAVDGIWERQISKAWLAVLKQNDTVFDIGANFGYFGLLAGQFTNKKKSKVVLFEANTNIIPYINKSVSVNWLNEQTKVENLAVSNVGGEVSLNVLKDYIGCSTIHSVEKLDSFMHEKMKLELAEIIKVESTTIDSYCVDNNIKEINLIKLDIEGYEEKAYSGMRDIVKKSKDITLFIEFTKDTYDNPKKFYETMLKDFGYVYIINDQGLIAKPEEGTYEAIIGQPDDWVMPVFSKNPELDKEHNAVI